MSKLIDEVARAIAEDYGAPNDRSISESAAFVLTGMFEERERLQTDLTGSRWYGPTDWHGDKNAKAVTILVPRAKPKPTLAEVVQRVLLRKPRVATMAADDVLLIVSEVDVADLRAALAREEGK